MPLSQYLPERRLPRTENGCAVSVYMPVPSWALCSLALAMAATNAHAQTQTTPPSDVRQQGEQQERLQREREEANRSLLQPAPKAPSPPTTDPRKPWPALESPCLPIHEIALVGDSSDSFQWVLDDPISGGDPAIVRCLWVDGVNIAIERAQQALIARGFVTSRIGLPPQSIWDGRLSLTLLPGRIRAIRFAQPGPRATALNAISDKEPNTHFGS